MKWCLIYIGIFFSAVSCISEDFRLREGDLLFQVNEPAPMSDAITDATGEDGTENFSHVAIALKRGGADSVLEASPKGGVRIVPLAAFLASSARIDGKPGVVVMRLRDTTGIAKGISRARGHLGTPYDFSFLPANGRMYCSELIFESYRREDGTPLFCARPMNFRSSDGTLPRFWVELFDRLGEPVPEGIPGTNPNDMAKEKILKEVYRYF